MSRWPTPDPDAQKFARDEMAKGRGSREVAAELTAMGYEVSHMTVARWAKPGARPKAAPAKATKPAPAPAALPAVPLALPSPAKPNALAAELAARKQAEADAPKPPPVDTSDTLGTLRGLLESFVGDAHANKLGNPRLAATLAKAATDVLDQIRKIEQRKAEDETTLKISREEIARAKQAALERFKALCDRPLLCSDCGRKLAIAWGEAAAKVAEAAASEGA